MKPCPAANYFAFGVALPCAGLFSRCRALAAPHLNRIKITGIRVMAIKTPQRRKRARTQPTTAPAGER